MNVVRNGSFLTLHYRLSGADGVAVVDTFADNPATLTLGSGQFAPGLEQPLIGRAEGERFSVELPAGSAFGERNPALVQRVKRCLVDPLGAPDAPHQAGEVLRLPAPDGRGELAAVVRAAGDDWLLLDFNHPLAGVPLRLDVQLLGVL